MFNNGLQNCWKFNIRFLQVVLLQQRFSVKSPNFSFFITDFIDLATLFFSRSQNLLILNCCPTWKKQKTWWKKHTCNLGWLTGRHFAVSVTGARAVRGGVMQERPLGVAAPQPSVNVAPAGVWDSLPPSCRIGGSLCCCCARATVASSTGSPFGGGRCRRWGEGSSLSVSLWRETLGEAAQERRKNGNCCV